MRVSTRLQISAILPGVLAIIITLILSWVAGNVSDVIPTLRAANNIAKGATSLDKATMAFVMRPGKETELKWRKAHADIGRSLCRDASLTAQDLTVLGDVKREHKEIHNAFDILAQKLTAENATAEDKEAAKELVSNLMGRSSLMVTGANTLAANGHTSATSLQEIAYLVIVVVSGILACILAAWAFVLNRRIARGIALLSKGMEQISRDELERITETPDHDELADLARGFNRMVDDLRHTREKLKNEITEKEKSAQSLREANVQLSDAMSKIRRAQSEMIQQERLQALRQMSRGIVHDLNDALTSVIGISEFYVDYPDQMNNADLRRSFAEIRDASRKAARVVRNISTFYAHAPAGKTSKVVLSSLIPETVSMTSPKWKGQKQAEGVDIKIATELAVIAPFEVNANDLTDAVSCLINNSVDALVNGGTITIKTRQEDGHAVIEVSDNGHGMEPDVRRRCLEPFFSTKGKGHSGMGLTAVNGFVDRANGTLDIQSVPEKGTTVTMRIPMIQTSVPTEKIEHAPLGRKIKVLAVDDEPWVTNTVRRHLQFEGHSAVTSNTGKDALEKFKADTFDLVMLDRAMPETSGDSLALAMKQMKPSVPIIMLTGFSDFMTQEGEIPASVDLVIGKPFEHVDICEAIAHVMAKASKRT